MLRKRRALSLLPPSQAPLRALIPSRNVAWANKLPSLSYRTDQPYLADLDLLDLKRRPGFPLLLFVQMILSRIVRPFNLTWLFISNIYASEISFSQCMKT